MSITSVTQNVFFSTTKVISAIFGTGADNEADCFQVGDQVVFVEQVDDTRFRRMHGVIAKKDRVTQFALIEFSWTYCGRLFTGRAWVHCDDMREYNEWLADSTAFHYLDNWQ